MHLYEKSSVLKENNIFNGYCKIKVSGFGMQIILSCWCKN